MGLFGGFMVVDGGSQAGKGCWLLDPLSGSEVPPRARVLSEWGGWGVRHPQPHAKNLPGISAKIWALKNTPKLHLCVLLFDTSVKTHTHNFFIFPGWGVPDSPFGLIGG